MRPTRKTAVTKWQGDGIRTGVLVLRFSFSVLLLLSKESFAPGDTVTFEDLTIPSSGFFNGDTGSVSAGSSVSTPIVSGGVSFGNTFGVDSYGGYDYPYWYGFAASKVVNTSDPDFTNQYASYPGGGDDGSANYIVAYGDGATLVLPAAGSVAGFRIANTTYAYLTMANGDPYGFTSPLAAPDGYFRVTATGFLGGNATGSADFYLTDFRNGASTGVLASWVWFDLSGLGTVDTVSFSFTGSDVGLYGLNTPAYFAMDNLVYSVPEPSTVAMLACGGAVAVAAWGRRRLRVDAYSSLNDGLLEVDR